MRFLPLSLFKYVIISPQVIDAGIAQLGERQTEDLKVACSIHAHRNEIFLKYFFGFKKQKLIIPKYFKMPPCRIELQTFSLQD